jgi:hypothetical protein
MSKKPTVPRRPRRLPFGVLAICGLLVLQSLVLFFATLGLLSVDPADPAQVEVVLKGFGLDLTIASDATLVLRLLAIGLATLFVLSFVQVVLLLLLRRSGWIITMLVVGLALLIQLISIWQGADPADLSLLLYALTAFYLNQSEVRGAFGIGASSVDVIVARTADAVAEGVAGEAA